METSSKTVKIVAYIVMGLWLLPINGMLFRASNKIPVTKIVRTCIRKCSTQIPKPKSMYNEVLVAYLEKNAPWYFKEHDRLDLLRKGRSIKNTWVPSNKKESPVKKESSFGSWMSKVKGTDAEVSPVESEVAVQKNVVDSDSVEYDSDSEDECNSDSSIDVNSDSDGGSEDDVDPLIVSEDVERERYEQSNAGATDGVEDGVVDPVVSKSSVEQSKENVASSLLGKVRKGFVKVAYGDFGRRY